MKYMLSAALGIPSPDVSTTPASNVKTALSSDPVCYRDALSLESLESASKFVNTACGLGLNQSHWCAANSKSGDWREFFNPISNALELHGLEGVEWWVRRRIVCESMNLHFDKDEHEYRHTGNIYTPRQSTVLYLSGNGGPTIITDQFINADVSATPSVPTKITVSKCEINSLLSFSGRQSHAVVGMPGNDLRTTLIMNWWDRYPLRVEPTPNTIAFPKISMGRLERRPLHVVVGTIFKTAEIR